MSRQDGLKVVYLDRLETARTTIEEVQACLEGLYVKLDNKLEKGSVSMRNNAIRERMSATDRAEEALDLICEAITDFIH